MVELQISLARALKLKNRTGSELKTLIQEVQQCNVYVIDKKPDVSAKNSYMRICEIRDQLIALKTTIENANMPMRSTIFRLSELKATVALLNTINTDVGIYKPTGYHFKEESETTYQADITRQDVKTYTKQIQKEIDELQEKLDAFNHNTQITVDASLITTLED